MEYTYILKKKKKKKKEKKREKKKIKKKNRNIIPIMIKQIGKYASCIYDDKEEKKKI